MIAGDTAVRDRFGVLPDGREVHRYTLGGPEGVTLCVLDYGAAVQQLWVPDATGAYANVVLGSADLPGYTKEPSDFFGAVIGRCANRVAGATVTVDGTEHALPANHGPHTLHGGPDGFHRRLWDVVAADRHRLTLRLVSPHGDQGLPGELTVHVTYTVEHTTVRIDLEATTTAPTVVNLTHHAHFNLAGEASGSTARHTLQVNASRFTPVRGDLIPLGWHAEVAGTAFDLRLPRTVDCIRHSPSRQIRLAHGLDHNYVLTADDGRPAAVLADPASGRMMELFTDQPGLQAYTGNFFDGSHTGTGGAPYDVAAGVALEPQTPPDAVHHTGEQDWPSPILRPGETYRSNLRWRFCARQPSAAAGSVHP